MQYKELLLGKKKLSLPLIQGGMGIGISRSSLAGAVAREGAMGVISTAQIGYDDPDFAKHPEPCNLKALPVHVKRAKEISEGNGLVGVNIMSPTQIYGEYVDIVCEAGVDAIISGAGLPTDLPLYARKYDVAIAPIVSSAKSAKVILKYWDVKHQTTADFLVIEGPKAGGHLGFSPDELSDIPALDYDNEVKAILEIKRTYEEKYGITMPVFLAGGIFTSEDVKHALSLGVDGVQVASRFVVTEECDASEVYKQAYINSKEEDIILIKSPVGLPGRAIRNAFTDRMQDGSEPITWCYNCLKACNPKTANYCISQALINAVNGDLDNGLIFCGLRTPELTKMTTVREVIDDLLCR